MNNDNNNSNGFIIPSMEEDNNTNNQPIYQAPTYNESMDNGVNVVEEPINNNIDIQPNINIEPPVVETQVEENVVMPAAPSIEEKPTIIEPINDIVNNPTNEFIQEPVQPAKSFIPDFIVEDANKNANYGSNDTVKPESTINSLMTNNSTDLYKSGPRVYAVEKPKTNIPIVILLTGIVLLVAGYFVYTFMDMATKKMVCESQSGTITLNYNKDTIVGYRSDNITYDLYEQRTYADEIGIKQYLDEFEQWFKTNTNGTCRR